jgi:glycosyltransferase involved in cell wall biosynthesis
MTELHPFIQAAGREYDLTKNRKADKRLARSFRVLKKPKDHYNYFAGITGSAVELNQIGRHLNHDSTDPKAVALATQRPLPFSVCSSSTCLRVAHLNSLLTGGGTDDQSIKLAAGLQRLGHHVWMAGPDDRELSKGIRAQNLSFHVTPPEGPGKLRFIFSSSKLLRRERVQIVHGHHGRDLWPTILAGRFSGIRPKIVLTRHLAKSPSAWFSRRFLLGQCNALIAVSHFVAKVLREGAYEPESPERERHSRPPLRGDSAKIHVIYGGIDTDRFHPFDAEAQRREWGLSPNDFAFAVVGGYDRPRGKGQREFLRAAAQVTDQIPQARFLIVGRGNLREILDADIARLGLQGKAWLTPYCHNMAAAMNAIDCLVHPQIGTEAFPGVVLEAFGCGKPVIASALDGIPEAFAAGKYGRLVPPEDIDSLATALVQQSKEPRATNAQRDDLHRQVASKFSVEAMVKGVADLYHQLIRGS